MKSELFRRDFTKLAMAGALFGLLPLPVLAKTNRDVFYALPKAVWAFRQSVAPDTIEALYRDCRNFHIGTIWLTLGEPFRVALRDRHHPAWVTLAAMKRDGMTLYALAGEAKWCETPEKLPQAVTDILALPGFSDVFSGLHLDIEPHTLPDWKDGRAVDRLIAGYLSLMATLRHAIPAELRLEVDIPQSYTKRTVVATGLNFTAEIARMVDGVALMTYRTPPDAAMRLANTTIDQLTLARCDWWMGVHCQSAPAPRTGYNGTTTDDFMSQMATLDTLVRRPDGLCQGLAFYQLSGLRQIMAA